MADAAVRIGFVGCGRQASDAWYPNFATIPELDLVACCDLRQELVDRNTRHYGALNGYTDMQEMLDQEDLDAVMVVGPPAMHYECGKQVLEAGLPLMMEKPVAHRTDRALELVELAESRGVITQAGHNMRHAPGVTRFRELMQTPEFGNLIFLESRYFMPGPMWHDTYDYREGWMYMIFQTTHAVDLARFVGGEIEKVYANLSVGEGGRFAIATVAHFGSGATGTITLTGNTPNWTCLLEAEGDARGHLRLVNLHTLHFETETPDSGYRPVPGIPGQYWSPVTRGHAEKQGGYWVQMQAFAKAVQSGTQDSPSLRDGYQAMRVCEAILDSIERGEPVGVPTD